jgi:hypothetical protein
VAKKKRKKRTIQDVIEDIRKLHEKEEDLLMDLEEKAPRKGESETALKNNNYPTKSGSEHVQNPLLEKADKAKY